ERHLGDRSGRLADPSRRPAIRDHAEALLPEELREIGQEVELVGELCIPGQRRGHALIIRRGAVRSPLPTRSGHTQAVAQDLRAIVCIPTYNERENLEPLLDELSKTIETERDRVLVIDDNSPDGTGRLADELRADRPWLDVLHRPAKEGIG